MCCLFGIVDYGNTLSGKSKTRMLSILAKECEARGTDATGIAYVNAGRLRVYKRPLPARRMRFVIPGDAKVIMGHTRLATQGSAKRNYNNHPFVGRCGSLSFALAHNGVIYNDHYLRRERKLPVTNIQTDSYVAVQLLQTKGTLSLPALKELAETVEGSFSFSLLDRDNHLYFIKGDNPLCIYYYSRLDLYVYASTAEILNRAVSKMRLPGKRKQISLISGSLMSAIAQFERDVIADRTREGLKAARARGRVGGRPGTDVHKLRQALKLYEARQHTVREIEELTGVKKATLYRAVAGSKK